MYEHTYVGIYLFLLHPYLYQYIICRLTYSFSHCVWVYVFVCVCVCLCVWVLQMYFSFLYNTLLNLILIQYLIPFCTFLFRNAYVTKEFGCIVNRLQDFNKVSLHIIKKIQRVRKRSGEVSFQSR